MHATQPKLVTSFCCVLGKMGQCNSCAVLTASYGAKEPLRLTLQSVLRDVSSLTLLCHSNQRHVVFAAVVVSVGHEKPLLGHPSQQGA